MRIPNVDEILMNTVLSRKIAARPNKSQRFSVIFGIVILVSTLDAMIRDS